MKILVNTTDLKTQMIIGHDENNTQLVKPKNQKKMILLLSQFIYAFQRWIQNPCHRQDGTLYNNNSFQPLTLVTKSSILNAERILDPPMIKEKKSRTKQAHVKQSFSRIIQLYSEAATRGVLCKMMFLEIDTQENTCARVSFLIKLQACLQLC